MKTLLILISTASLLVLGACSGGNQAAKTESATKPTEAASTTQAESATKEAHKEGDGHDHKGADGKGGQVVEMGEYHLEFATHKTGNGISLDLLLQKGEAHQPVTDAKVTAQVQMPDGTQKPLEMKYDAAEKAYKAVLPGAAAGEYQVAILADVAGKKMNGRFSFKQ
ncbi:hypothetical protein ACQ4M3_01525 [Leptolyngbya sp. AN03gr2]|uniref:hypothetical protein n=1 Tax=unclassified Leptolyngbya TaxID=2650499 RepID=UPI003D31A487